MPVRTRLMDMLGIEQPVIQAPMAGGGDTPALVAAVCEAGGIGCVGAAYLSAAQIGETARAIRARTNRAFGINLFAPQPVPAAPADPGPALELVAPFFAELGLPPAAPVPAADPFEDRLAAALESGAAMLSFTMGTLPDAAVRATKARGMLLIGTATTVAEAQALQRNGVDAVVAQGGEAGGHRGTFPGNLRGDPAAGLVGTMALVPQVVDAVAVPVIASGGIMDGRGIAAALALGAGAAQMGTAFLTCDEAGAPSAYKAAILDATEDSTRVTRAFSGRPARGIANRFMTAVDAGGTVLDFPLQNALTRPLRTEAARRGQSDMLSLWAGQGVRMARRGSARDLMAALAAETEAALERLRAR